MFFTQFFKTVLALLISYKAYCHFFIHPQTTTGRCQHISVFIKIARPNLDLAVLVCSSRRNEGACMPFKFLEQMLSICKHIFLNYLPTYPPASVTCHGIRMLTVRACRGLQRANLRLLGLTQWQPSQKPRPMFFTTLSAHKTKVRKAVLTVQSTLAFILDKILCLNSSWTLQL